MVMVQFSFVYPVFYYFCAGFKPGQRKVVFACFKCFVLRCAGFKPGQRKVVFACFKCIVLRCAGFKPGQRKVVFACFKRNLVREVKVAQLAGSVAELSAYHHGEVTSGSAASLSR